MNTKKITGVVLIILGALVLTIALYAKGRISDIKSDINKGSGLFPNNPVNKHIGQALEKKVGAYDAPIMWGMIGGIVLVVVGVGTMMMSRRK